ncbi:Protein BTB-1 [Aphelenchoides avenae]|nr:Protein BTB-1 [Aphelenchus avenae]
MYGTPALPQQREKAHAEHVKELSHAHIWLAIRGIRVHIESYDKPTGPISWKLCASTTKVGDEVEIRCRLEGRRPPGYRRWVAATFFLYRRSQPLEGTVMDAKLVVGNPIYNYGDVQFVYREKAQNLEDYRREHEDLACYPPLIWIGATVTTWKDTLDDKEEQDDVKFTVQDRAVYANKAHLSYISPVLRNMLKQNTDGSINLDDTAEAFIIFMKAILPGPREPITDSTVQLLYRTAVKYNVKFLIEKCEQHLVATKAMTKNEKVLLACELHRTRIVDDIIAGATKESPSEDKFHKGEPDDVEFMAGGRSVYANKEYISYHSTLLRGTLRDHFRQGNSNQSNVQKIPVSSNADDFVLFMKAISPCQLAITGMVACLSQYTGGSLDDNVQKLYRLADYYGAPFLLKSCERHLLTTNGIPAVDRLITAQSLNKTDIINRLIASLNAEDVQNVLWSPKKTELSEDSARKLSDHYMKKTKPADPRRSVGSIRSASNTVGIRRSSSSNISSSSLSSSSSTSINRS